MELRISAEARRLIAEGGGRLFVYPGAACCGGTRYIRTSTRPPEDADNGYAIEAEGVGIWVKPANGELPEFLEVEVRGKRRQKVEAYWNGCSFVI
ncbi:MAG: hypothetical protein M0000_09905 [Actinomycetota bacterium]|nr:hypothetical protein [Actinomycetota bacterium]MDA8207698.1 hypothetical protein [Actinomycetota bacterium]